MSGGPFERVGDTIFSLDPNNRHLCDCDEHRDKPPSNRGTMTRKEWIAWSRENRPNGYCICYPERGIVCGLHDPRLHP